MTTQDSLINSDAAAGDRLKDRLRRLLVMVPWVMEHPGISVEEVCSRFGISRKELLRDIHQIMVCGVYPYSPGDLMWASMDDDVVTISEAHYFERPLRLAPGEALSLLAAGRAALQIPGIGEQPALESALRKIERVLAPDLDGAPVGLDLAVDSEQLATLTAAVEARSEVLISYQSATDDEVRERRVAPIRVFAFGGRWYLYAFCRIADDYRFFRLDRIKSAEVTEARFDLSTLPEARGELDPRPHASEFDLKLRVDGEPEEWLREYLETGEIVRRQDGSALLTIRAASREWAIGLLLRLGGTAEIIEPVGIAGEVKDVARQMLAQYAALPSSS